MTRTQDLAAVGNRTVSRNYSPQDVVLSHGRGLQVWDIEGNEYLDFLAGIAVNTVGHAHPDLVAAIADQASRLIQVSNAYWTEPQIALQQKLTEVSFAERVFFANCGATANEAAIKLARRYQRVIRRTPRFEVITFTGSFHGRTYGAISATAQPKYHAGFEPMVPGFVYGRFNDLASVEALLGAHTAAILVEPVQGEGGVVPATDEFLRGLRAICDREGIVLIFDEVQTGIGRTGRMFAYEHSKVAPDVMTLAKGLGGGVPIGAMLTTEEVSAGFTRGSHATTFGGNALATRAALTVLSIVERDGLIERAARMGERIRSGAQAFVHSGVAREVRGMGLLNGIEIHGDADMATRVVLEARRRGLLLNTAGGNVLRLVPALTLVEDDVDRALAILSASLDAAIR